MENDLDQRDENSLVTEGDGVCGVVAQVIGW